MIYSRIMKVSHGIIGRQRELTSSFSRFRGGLYHPVVRRLSYTVKNKYINQEMHRRITENKAKFPVKKEIKMKSKEVYKSKAEFGPSYAQQLQQTCVVIAVGYFFCPGLPKFICTTAATIGKIILKIINN